MAKQVIRVGSRRSPLAKAQTWEVIKLLRSRFPELRFEIVGIATEGDRTEVPKRGKDVFVKAIEEQLIEGNVDMAVHSMKDVPINIPRELTIASVPKRKDPRDALVTLSGLGLKDLPKGARIGTSSLRRKIQLLNVRPDLKVVEIRGNVETRIEKMKRLGLDAIVLAYVGLLRLGVRDIAIKVLNPEVMIPAAGQGALAIEARKDDYETIQLAKAVEDPATRVAVDAERFFLSELGGGCNVPAAVYARVEDGRLVMDAMVSHNGSGLGLVRARVEGSLQQAMELARQLAEKVRLKHDSGRTVEA